MTNRDHSSPDQRAANFRDAGGQISPDFVRAVEDALASEDVAGVRDLTRPLHPADLGALIEAIEPAERAHLVRLLGPEFDFEAITELDDTIRRELLKELPAHTVAEGVRDLDSDDAVAILEELEKPEQDEIIAQLPASERLAVERALEYPEDSAGRRMRADFIAIPALWNVGQMIDFLREADDLPDEFHEIFVVDADLRLAGTLALNRILRSRRSTSVADIMDPSRMFVRATDDQEAVVRLFERYNLVSAAVVDDAERLVGVITVDDVVDVLREGAEEDVNRLVGVDAEAMARLRPRQAALRRIPWLLVTMAIELCAGLVIAHYDVLLQRVILLASFMPVISAISGNVGLQAAAITVRGLDTGQLTTDDGLRALRRESATNVFMAIACGIVLGAIRILWSGRLSFGIVIGVALFAAMLTAGAMGTIIPLTSKRLGFDPAVTAGPFETAFQDVIGFAVFLWLASLLLNWLE